MPEDVFEERLKYMAVITIIKEVKRIHPYDLVLVKIGTFYHAYGRDSYILSFIFKYKLKLLEEDYYTCGFPENSFGKIINKLENLKINYLIIDRRNDYEVDEKKTFNNLNRYEEIYENAKKYVNIKRRIDKIYNNLLENINEENIKEKVKEIEKILYERRKI